MELRPFSLERYFAKYEFKARHLLSSSDCETLSQQELVALADSATGELWKNLRLGYTESSGHPLLRREIANLYKTVWPDDVLVVTPEEGIFLALNVLLKPGDHVVILSPSYQSLYEVAAGTGADVTRWMLEIDGIKWKLDLSFLQRSVRSSTKLLVINFPHNPSGYHPDQETFGALLDFAQERKISVFSDEMYRFAEYNPRHRLPSAADTYEGGVTLGGLSKSFGLPGLRIGWLATKNKDIMRRFVHLKDYTTICSSAPSEILGIIALRARDIILDRTRGIVQTNLDHAERFFATHHTFFEWIRPLAGPVAFPRLKFPESIDHFCQHLVETHGVMLVPGSHFDFPGNHFRMGLGKRDFPEALGVLDQYLRDRSSEG